MDKTYFTISEVAKQLSVKPSLIRFWEKEFNPIIKPIKNSKGERRYRQKDINQLTYIYKLVKEKGYSLKGARKVITSHSHTFQDPENIVHKLHEIRSFLIDLKNQMQNS